MKYKTGHLQLAASHPYIWHLSLACFVIAGLTGFLYRMGMLGWVPEGLALGNIRHAHSHLMFFGWAVPLPLYILMSRIRGKTGWRTRGLRWMKNSIVAGILFGILAYPCFLWFGYRPVELAGASLPLSVMLSGMVMISWYGFVYGYVKSRSGFPDDSSRLWMDGSLLMLVISSLGAWGVAVVQAIDPSSHLFMKGLTHFFLATFTEGWIVVVLLAILTMHGPEKRKAEDVGLLPQVALGCIAIGAPLTFPYGIAESLLSPMLLFVARAGGAIASAGLLLYLYSLWTVGQWKRRVWIWPLALLALKGIMQLTASFLPSVFWLSDHAIRIFYLHVLLLGAYTLGLSGWLTQLAGISRRYSTIMAWAVSVTLFSLILPSGLWPSFLSGFWIFEFIALAALLPVAAMLLVWYKLFGSTVAIPS